MNVFCKKKSGIFFILFNCIFFNSILFIGILRCLADVYGCGGFGCWKKRKWFRGFFLLLLGAGLEPAALDRIEISSPSPSLARGTMLNLSATAIYKDDTHRDITLEADWSPQIRIFSGF